MALVDLDPRLVTRLRTDTPARRWVLETLSTASSDRSHATTHLRQAARDARKLRSRERRALFDLVYDLIRYEQALAALDATTWASALDALLDGASFDALPFAVRAGLPAEDAQDVRSQMQDPEAWLAASNRRAPTVIRVNLKRTNRPALIRALADRDIVTEPVGDHGLQVVGRANLLGHPLFKKGHFEVQDAASQCVAAFVDGVDKRVLDLCAGAGGKSLALASLGADVVATDIRQAPLRELRKRAQRAGTRIPVVEREHRSSYERVLVDAPCSGSGVLRRHPEFRWRLAEGKPSAIQRQLLEDATYFVVPSGSLIYATCSVLRSENEDVVDRFLAEHPDWQREVDDLRTYTHLDGMDGMYAARLRRRIQ